MTRSCQEILYVNRDQANNTMKQITAQKEMKQMNTENWKRG